MAIECGGYHTACLMQNGELYTWGKGNRGALGTDTSHNQFGPIHVKFTELTGPVVTAISCGDNHTACVDEQGRIYTFGANDYGQLGVGSWDDQYSPVLAG